MQIELLLMDVDGTMTDGGVMLSQTEEVAFEIKTLDAHDGQGLTLAHTASLRTGCITGRQSSALLRTEFIYMKQAPEDARLRRNRSQGSCIRFCCRLHRRASGSSLLCAAIGLAVVVGNAVPEVKETAHYTTKTLAGHGAIRETVELILKSKGTWNSMIDKARVMQ